MTEYPHHHRVQGRGRRVSPTGGITTSTTFDLQHLENLVQSGDDTAAVGGDDLVQGNESDLYNNGDEESGNVTGLTREDVFPQVNLTPEAASRSRIPWEQRRSHSPATAIAMMMSPSWQGTQPSPRSGEGMYLEPSEYARGLDRQRLPILGNQSGQLSQEWGDEKNTEDEHIIPVADDGEAYSSGREGVIGIRAPSFGFELASSERGISVAHSPPSRFLLDDPLASVEIIPFEEEEKSIF